MTIVFDHVHMDDLDAVLDMRGEPVYPYDSVPLKSINRKRVLDRADAMTRESIARRNASNIGAGSKVKTVS